MENTKLKSPLQEEKTIYENIASSPKFIQMVKSKNKFLVPLSVFFLLFYFSLPLLTSYSNILNKPALGPISWVWIFAFAQFIMTWSLSMIYVRKANQFDQLSDEILNDFQAEDKGEQQL
ncbi:DUF485 domain-containing protein [Bacillus badius]|uniref:DUF485 domain-containing protein n=1 Tax=Bacillus badius TaxID=1455 RepID=A0ABR5B1D9_BACBA|nr:DUF485 domain-containing protein [Bacillus badius]KIL80787.1 hypothetical protein SD77_0635 [Bacillus badius]MED4715289.1 DUF485 domain-containing protein [Bacillus badius]